MNSRAHSAPRRPLSISLLGSLVCVVAIAERTPASPNDGAAYRSALQLEKLERNASRAFGRAAFARAAKLYAESTALDPVNGRAWHRLGICALKTGDHAGATAAFMKQLTLGYDPANARFQLGCTMAAKGDTDAALEWLERAVRTGFKNRKGLKVHGALKRLRDDSRFQKLQSKLAEIARTASKACSASGARDWKRACEGYAAVVAATPDDPCSLHQLGFAQISLGEYAASEKSFGRALRAGYDRSITLYNLACACARQGKHERALGWLRDAVDAGFHSHKKIRTDPDLASLRASREHGARFEAIRLDALALEKNPELAKLSVRLGDWENALRICEAWTARDPKSGEAWSGLASANYALGRHTAAAAARLRQVELRHEVPRAVYELARAKAKIGDKDAALAHLRDAVDVGQSCCNVLEDDAFTSLLEDARFHDVRRHAIDQKVLAKFGVSDWREAEAEYAARVREKPNDGKAQHRLAWAHMRLGRTAAALACFREQERLGFRPSAARINIACIHARNGDADAAFSALEGVVDIGCQTPESLGQDPDLWSLRKDPRFAAFAERLRAACQDD